MGTRIEHVAVSTGRWRHRTSALALANTAVRRCLEAGTTRRDSIDILINAGIYRDRNLGEPALAALIQDDSHLHTEDPHPGTHGTFSFDVANGTCGVLTSLQIVDGFQRAGTVDRAVIVASDADPGHGSAPDFPMAAAGAAALCAWTDDERGVGPFRWLVAPGTASSFQAVVRYEDGTNRLRLAVADGFATEAAVAAAKVADEVLASAGVSPSAIDAVVVAPATPAFVEGLADALGVPAARFVHAPDPRLHTASFLAAFEAASASGRLAPASTALFVCAGAGITAGACLYRP